MPPVISNAYSLLMTHPGNELPVFGWLEQSRPTVFVLLNGRGTDGTAALETTSCTLDAVGARRGEIFGRFTERQFYESLLSTNFAMFQGLAVDLAGALARDAVDCVVSDTADDASPLRDVWRAVISTAVAIAEQTLERVVTRYEYSLERPAVADSGERIDSVRRPALEICLDDLTLQRKLRAAQEYQELADRVAAVRQAEGPDAGRQERLFAASGATDAWAVSDHRRPAYELQGERQVARGRHARVVRFQNHVAPVLRCLDDLRRAA